MFHIVLHRPVIPPNTGNVIRLAANVGFKLHLIKPLGFNLETKQLRRAGLDYHDLAFVEQHENYGAFSSQLSGHRCFAITTKGSTSYSDISFLEDDVFVFGSEDQGLPTEIMDTFEHERRLRIPMQPNNRSLNLSNAVAVIAFEVWRQKNFKGGL